MSLKIQPNTELHTLRGVIGSGTDRERIRSSMSRRQWLERLACIHAGEPIYIQLGGSRAYCDIAGKDSEFGHTDRVIINIPTEVPKQVSTDLPPKVWDALFQKTELYHEFGHYLYTDWPSFEEALLSQQRYRTEYQNWWNIVEDAAIERLLAGRFNIKDDLYLKNENLLRDNQPPSDRRIGFIQAVSVALMEYKHPLGNLKKVLDGQLYQMRPDVEEAVRDGALPIIEKRVPEIIAEGDPVERNNKFEQFFEAMRVELDELDSSQRHSGTPIETFLLGSPDDGEDKGEGSEGATAVIPQMDDDEKQVIRAQIDPDAEEPEDPPQPSGIEVDAESSYGNQVRQDQELDDDEVGKEMEKWLRVIQKDREETGYTSDLVVYSDHDFDLDAETYQKAKRLAVPLEREFRQRLRQEEKTKPKRGQRWGKLDGRSLYKAERGETRIFSRRVEPDEKDYSTIILIDKSGSMSGGRKSPSHVEQAGGALAIALEEVGVDVEIMEYYKGSAYLSKPFGQSVEEAKSKVFNGRNSGGTPATNALKLARKRLDDQDGQPFIMILTDGGPDNRESYRDELHACNIPVVGIYVSSSGSFEDEHKDEAQYYHRLVFAKSIDAAQAARDLAAKIMF